VLVRPFTRDTSPPGDVIGQATIDAISQGSREAFTLLFEQTAGPVGAELAARFPDPDQCLRLLAATYVEVWWLAGCGTGAEPGVTDWIMRILQRRMADATRSTGVPGGGDPHRSYATMELADLLGRPVDRLWPGGQDG
jgi:hypothetical protein